jgi:hypothetical protein
MKLKTFINLLSVLALNLSSTAVYADLSQLENQMASQEQECLKQTNMSWDNNLNRCVRSAQSQEELDDYKECAAMTDDAARKQCHDQIANDRSGSLTDDKDQKGGGINYIFGAAAGLNILSSKGKGSQCMSGYVAAATGILGGFAQKMFVKGAKKKLEELQKKYKEGAISEDAYQAQVKAFEYLRDEQLAIEDMAKKRQMTYYAISAGYGAALFMVWKDMKKPTCKGESSDSSDTSSAEPATVTTVDTPTDTAPATESAGEVTAETDVPGTSVSSQAAEGIASAASKTMDIFSHWGTVAVASGLGVLWNMKLAMAAGKQAKEAKENANRINKVIADFQTNVAGLCPQGREDMQNPRCFCYAADGAKHEDRTNSGICQELWAADDRSLYVNPDDKVAGAKSNTVGCVDFSGKFDESCKCKNFKTNSGENACMKVKTPTNVSMNGANQFATAQLLGSTNSMINGKTPVGTFTGFNPASQAAIAKKIADQSEVKINKLLKEEGISPVPLTGKFADHVAKKLANSPIAKKAVAGTSFTPIVDGRPTKGGIAEALKKAQEKAGIKKMAYSDKKTSLGGKRKKKKRYDFSFSDDGKIISTGKTNKEFMNKKYDYKENDIITRDDVSIWKVITRRYNVSGLKRLFPDE